MRPLRSGLTSGTVAACLALVVGALATMIVPRLAHSGSGRAIDLELPPGSSRADAIARLVAAGVVDHPHLLSFTWAVFGHGDVRPGKHLLADDLSPLEVVRRLTGASNTARVKVTIPEGWNRFDIAKRLADKRVCDADEFLAATSDPALLTELELSVTSEGWLFPSTYTFPADGDPRDLVRRMVGEAKARFDKLKTDVGVSASWPSAKYGARELMILASIVEREAAADDERAIIASVFQNRLLSGAFSSHLLQADPTAVYGCLTTAHDRDVTAPCQRWLAAGSLKTNAEIQHDPLNRWSTYTNAGLPPTAIANPGDKSIAAVLAPAATKYLYFVAKGGGHHTFSETLEAHTKAVKGAGP